MIDVVFEGADLVQTHPEDQDEPSWLSRLPRPLARALATIRALPDLGIWLGMVLAAAGGVLLLIAWRGTAGLTDVRLQLTYVVSAGFSGLGLIAVGMTCVSVAAKRADAKLRIRQAAELRASLAELRSVMDQEQR